jgi:hypothetical protein
VSAAGPFVVASLCTGRRSLASCAKIPRRIRRCPIFAAYDCAEQKKSQKSVLAFMAGTSPAMNAVPG